VAQSKDRANETLGRGAEGDSLGAAVWPQPFSGIDAIAEDLRSRSVKKEIIALRNSARGNLGSGSIYLIYRAVDGSRQRSVIWVRVTGSRDEDLGWTHVLEYMTKLVREFVLVIAQSAVRQIEFETINLCHPEDVECPMPFKMTDPGDLVCCRSRSR
jgi:hypothetical protein